MWNLFPAGHEHAPACGHVFALGCWYVFPPDHVHGAGCGHVFADGEWRAGAGTAERDREEDGDPATDVAVAPAPVEPRRLPKPQRAPGPPAPPPDHLIVPMSAEELALLVRDDPGAAGFVVRLSSPVYVVSRRRSRAR